MTDRHCVAAASADEPSTCPGRCNSDWRRAEETGQPHELKPIPGRPVWCQNCAANIETALSDFPELWAQLEDDKGRRTGDRNTQRVSTSTDAASPSPEHDEQDELLRFFWSWEDDIREHRGFGERPGRPDLMGTLAFHLAHAGWALQHKDIGKDYGQELLQERGRLRGYTRTGSGFQAKSMSCPRCQEKRLVHELGTDYITCQNGKCGRMMKQSEYDQIVRTIAA